MIRSLLATLTALAVSATAPPVLTGQSNNMAAHARLLESISNTGVSVYVNPSVCFNKDNKGLSGFYISQSGVFAVCQDHREEQGVQARWTDNDLDTIRHEAQHLVQDCLDGRGDNSLINFFPVEPKEGELGLREFALRALSQEEINIIISNYMERGADENILRLEVEAFSVARVVDADSITQAIKNVCSIK